MRCRFVWCWLVALVLLGACGPTPEESSSTRTEPTVASADARSSGAPGGPNRISGTDEDDVLTGTDGRDLIDGRRGVDVISGGAGDDVLRDFTGVGTGRRLDTTADTFVGGPGDDVIFVSHRDRVRAGPGDDRVVADYLEPGDAVACGPGRDVVVLNDNDPGLVLTGCERIRVRYAG